MNIKHPKPLNQSIANFCAGFFGLSLSSHIFLIPGLERGEQGSLLKLVAVIVFGFFAARASNSFVRIINKAKISRKMKSFLIWILPIFYLLLFSIPNTFLLFQKYKG